MRAMRAMRDMRAINYGEPGNNFTPTVKVDGVTVNDEWKERLYRDTPVTVLTEATRKAETKMERGERLAPGTYTWSLETFMQLIMQAEEENTRDNPKAMGWPMRIAHMEATIRGETYTKDEWNKKRGERWYKRWLERTRSEKTQTTL